MLAASCPLQVLASGPRAGTVYSNSQTYITCYKLPVHVYTFTARDSYGDGWNGGTFMVSKDGKTLTGPNELADGLTSATDFQVTSSTLCGAGVVSFENLALTRPPEVCPPPNLTRVPLL